MKHEIYEDMAGWGNHPRLTCTVCNKTLVKQPYMTLKQWEQAKEDFTKEHENKEQETK